MRRRRTFFAAVAALCVLPLRAGAQPAVRVFRLGILRSRPAPSAAGAAEFVAFERPLRDLGYVEGRNPLIETRYAQNDLQRLPTRARELVELKVDMILPVAAFEASSAPLDDTSGVHEGVAPGPSMRRVAGGRVAHRASAMFDAPRCLLWWYAND